MIWREVRAVFEAVLELPPAAREQRLAELAAHDVALAQEVRALLDRDAGDPVFLERDRAGRGNAEGLPGQRLGRFELVRPLGSGGMGTVWEARQAQPERSVALKLLTCDSWSAAARWRFEHEIQVLAALNHPGIATFYEAGSHAGEGGQLSWLAMELVEGAVDLLSWAEERHLTRAERIELFTELCAAVEYGHQRGVLHRDLKPSNVLVGRDGCIKLIDFGVARAVDGSAAAPSLRTRTGEVVGTMQYMAPEQLAGRANEIGVGCDVYALGVILYHLLCGRPPFDFGGKGLLRIATIVLEQEPVRPSLANPGLPADLDWILLTALAREPSRRYQSVRELVEDLERFRRHEPVRARPPSTIYRLAKFARRHRVPAAIALAVALGLAVGGWGLFRGLQRARTGEASATREAARSGQVLGLVEGLFDGIDDTVDGREVKVAQLLGAAALDPGRIADPSVEFTVRAIRGATWHRLQMFEQARVELERALALASLLPTDGTDRARLVDVRARLGSALTRLGEAARGETMLRGAIADAEREGLDGARMQALMPLCGYLCEKGAHAELQARAGEIGALARKLGQRRAELHADEFLALALGGLGRAEEALSVLERVWRGRELLLGARDKQTVTAMFNFATALQEAGKLGAAEALYPQVIESTRATFSPTHNQTLTTLNNFAALASARGNRSQAVASLRDVVSAYDQRPGTPTAEHLAAINNLGMTLKAAQAFAEAEPVLRRAAELSCQLLAEDDVNQAVMRFNHAACLAAMKRWAEAEPVLLAQFARLEKTLPPQHTVLAKARKTIADGYSVNGDPNAAARWRKP